MKKILFLWFLIIWALLTSCSNENDLIENTIPSSESTASVTPIWSVTSSWVFPMSIASGQDQKAEKIEIVLFHGTVRCVSCNAMEEMTKKTLEAHFQAETNAGKITFIAVNGEDPKNAELVRKYAATWLSIFINGITKGKDAIVEEKNLWRYLQNEEQFQSYLTDTLHSL